MTLLRRTLIPTLGQSLISESEMGISKRLFQMRMADGCEVEAFLLYDSNLGGVLKIIVKGSHGEDVRLLRIGRSLPRASGRTRRNLYERGSGMKCP
jgi:hypothetical protein